MKYFVNFVEKEVVERTMAKGFVIDTDFKLEDMDI